MLTHAGESYVAKGRAALEAAAEASGWPVVGRGGDPARGRPPLPGGQRRLDADAYERALASRALTEFRAGVCVFFDLFQAGVGVCCDRRHRALGADRR